ncbi:MAG: BTAD domain-containing putative transcriptional regulator [Pikeienuella sp.]
MAEAILRVRGFGVAGIYGRDDAVIPGIGAKALGMIVYLATQAPAQVSRDTLVNLLWDSVDPAQGKSSLRQELSRLKRAIGTDVFGGVFDINDRSLCLKQGAFWFDGAEFERAAMSDEADEIAQVLDLYSGDFLADNAARSEPFQEWVQERRGYYHDLFVAAALRLSGLDQGAGRFERARAAAERVIAADPTHEPGHEALIRTLFSLGSRAQAQAHYERLRKMAHREHGADPQSTFAELTAPEGARPPPAEPLVLPVNKIRPTIAVLNAAHHGALRGDDEQAYLAAGVVEELVANLSKSIWIKVAALDAPFLPLEAAVDRAARDLRGHADYVLRVNVRVGGNRAAIIATLNRVADNAIIFSDSMEDDLDDLLTLQRRTAMRISSIFVEKVVGDQSETLACDPAPPPKEIEPAHWRLLMKARWLFWTSHPVNNAEAQVLLKQALDLQPDDVASRCILSFSYMLDAWCGWGDDVAGSIELARETARTAVGADPGHAWAQFTLGVANSTHDRLDEAKTRQRHALRLDPGLIGALGELGRVHLFAGDTAAAHELSDQALSLSPYDQHSGLWARTKALAHYLDGEIEQALERIEYSIIIRPGWFQNYLARAVFLVEAGHLKEAKAAFAEGRKMVRTYDDNALRYGHPFSDPAIYARFVEALNKAGGQFRV